MAMLRSRRDGLSHADDAGALHYERRAAALDGDAVVLDVLDLADDAACGGDVVALLERPEHLRVFLARPGLRPDQQEPEDADHQAELQREKPGRRPRRW